MMPITESNVHQHELIGLDARIGYSKNASQKRLHGMIVDETTNTITVSDGLREKVIPKKDTSFILSAHDGSSFVVEGSRFLGKPVERVKNNSGGL